MKKKPTARQRSISDGITINDDKQKRDSTEDIKGRNVDYFRYFIIFRIKRCANCFDSILVEHTSQYNTLIEVDQSRLSNMIDTIAIKNILMVYIKKYNPVKEADPAYFHMEKHRKKAIQKFLKVNGIDAAKIKLLQDSLSPPRL